MSDTTNTSVPVPTAVSTVSPSWTQEAWDAIETWEQDLVAYLHHAGLIFEADIWPFIKAGLGVLLSVAGKAALQAEIAAIPAEMSGNVVVAAAAVGAAITGAVAANAEAIAKTEGDAAAAAIQADPNATVTEKALAAEGETLIPNGTDAAASNASGGATS